MAIALNGGRSRINLLSLVLALYLFATGVYITLGDSFDIPAAELGGGYVALLLVTCWISAYPYQIKARAAGAQTTMSEFFVRQFWQPALWSAETAELAEFQKRRAGTLFKQ